MVLFDDASAKREPQSPTARLGRKTGLKNTFEIGFRDTLARILHVDIDPFEVVGYAHVYLPLPLQRIEGVLQQVFHHPLEQGTVYHRLHRGDGESVVAQGYVTRDARAEIHHAAAHHLVHVGRRQHRLRAYFGEAVGHLHQPREVLVHLLYDGGVDVLRLEVLYPAKQRRDGRTELMGRLLGKPYPYFVLFILLRAAEGEEPETDEDDYHGELYERKDREPFSADANCRRICRTANRSTP